MDTDWSAELIADYVAKWCKQKETTDGPEGKIDIIITFDEKGVSGHCNHKSVFHGCERLMEKKMVDDCDLMALKTVSTWRKFIGILDVNFLWNDEWHAFRYNVISAYRTLAQHESQLVWFRKLFIIFSRYTYINSFVRYVQTGKSNLNQGDANEGEELKRVDEDVLKANR